MSNLLKFANTIENTWYYGCGDEGYELWQSMCSLCYQLVGLGQYERAEILLGWIIDDAKQSKQWCLEWYGSLEEVDKEKGCWGYGH